MTIRICPDCGAKCFCKDSRIMNDYIRRRYNCEACDYKVSSIEMKVSTLPMAQKRLDFIMSLTPKQFKSITNLFEEVTQSGE